MNHLLKRKFSRTYTSALADALQPNNSTQGEFVSERLPYQSLGGGLMDWKTVLRYYWALDQRRSAGDIQIV